MKLFSSKLFDLQLVVIFLFFFSFSNAFGASSNVDPGFYPKLIIDITGNYTGDIVFQPDGKLIVFGTTNIKPFFRRLNADGSLDSTFDCPECFSITVNGVAVQPDGKIIVAGSGKVIRVLSDGSFDRSFNTPSGIPIGSSTATRPIVQPDGKVLIHCQDNTTAQETIRRLNANGSLDASFSPIVLNANYPRQAIGQMLLLADGKILLGGGYQYSNDGWIERHNADGTLDSSFQTTISSTLKGIGVTTDGNYLITGSFYSVNGIFVSKFAKLLSNGSLDSSFPAVSANNDLIGELKILPNGQFYVKVTAFSPITGDPVTRLVRYNANGTVDNTFSQIFNYPANWAVDNLNRIVTYKERDDRRLFRLKFDGTNDATFNPAITVDGYVNSGVIQADGKIVIGGEFGKLNGSAVARFARLNADGTTDAAFSPGSGFDAAPQTLALQPDGKILVAGPFSQYNGTPRANLVRINADGSLDTAFAPLINQNVSVITLQPDGKILIGGSFTSLNGTSRTGIARLNADGSIDATFNSTLSNSSSSVIVYTIFAQTDGKIMIGGTFTNVNGNYKNYLARLNSDGTLDGSFPTNPSVPINHVIQQTDGKYIISYKNSPVYFETIERRNNDGSIDYGFARPQFNAGYSVNTLYQQPNGDLIVGGNFSWIGGRYSQNLARLGPNGEVDTIFPTVGANNAINKILGQSDGKIVLLGSFSSVEVVGRTGIARLVLRNSLSTPFYDYDGDGKSDISVFRPDNGAWYLQQSTNGFTGVAFGQNGDRIVPADYDGDGKTDVAVFRQGIWYLQRSNAGFTGIAFGAADDVPVPADYDGDGKADVAVFRPSNGTWYLLQSTAGFAGVTFGQADDKPVAADYDGDNKADIAVFRSGIWYIQRSQLGFTGIAFGDAADKPVAADYDGDGKADVAVFRSGTWYLLQSTAGFRSITFGQTGDLPTPADYDGDGKSDIAVFRNGTWYLNRSTAGFTGVSFGAATDIPIPSAYLP